MTDATNNTDSAGINAGEGRTAEVQELQTDGGTASFPNGGTEDISIQRRHPKYEIGEGIYTTCPIDLEFGGGRQTCRHRLSVSEAEQLAEDLQKVAQELRAKYGGTKADYLDGEE